MPKKKAARVAPATKSTKKKVKAVKSKPLSPKVKKVPAVAKGSKPDEELSVAVTFRGGHGQPGLVSMRSVASAEQRKACEPDEATLRKTVELLSHHGFELSSRGKYSIVVRGDRKDFEKLFGTKLDIAKLPAANAARASADSVYFPAAGAAWNPDPGIAQLIDDAYIQWPHIYMNSRFAFPPSALPPRVDFHHLRVPGDVAMLLNAAKVHRAGVTGRGVRVAMIDSGFNHSHPYFKENGYRSSVVLAPGATNVATDSNGHGTGESANLFAVAPDIQFIGVKLDDDAGGPGASMLAGLQEALRQNPKVISVSLGFDLVVDGTRKHLTPLPNSLKALEAEIQAAVASGIVIVFSAGNGHVSFPGMMPEVISAGGVFVGEDGKMQASDYASGFKSKIYPGRKVPDFSGLVGLASNHADYIALPIQPNCEIDVDNSQHDGSKPGDGWGLFSGTSAAAPQLAGVCALLLEKSPGLSPSEIKQIIRRTSRDVINGSANKASSEGVIVKATSGGDGATGTGLVDAFAAFKQL